MSKYNYGVLILSHGRADNVITYDTLRRQGYSGEIVIVCDDEDDELDGYRKRYDHVVVFSKDEVENTFDMADLQDDHGVVVYARNVCHQVASELGWDCFIELDDDYSGFYIAVPGGHGNLKHIPIENLDGVFELTFDFLYATDAYSVAFAQAGDFIGGLNGNFKKRLLRKAMNSFFCRVDKPFQFMGRLNEDVNSYVVNGMRGMLFFTICNIMLVQKMTQSNKGGLTDSYLSNGTYVKSFYTVMMAPSCVKVRAMGLRYPRLHHNVAWDHAVPKIVSSKWKKGYDAQR